MNRLISLCLVLVCSCVAAQGGAAGGLSPDSSLEQVLDALHARGEGLKDFTADVSLAQTDALGSGTSTLIGKVYYQAREDDGARMRVAFDKRQVGSKVDNQARLVYLLDKGWLIEQDFKRRIQVDRQVLRPGQKINLLKLGEGPFPLPIGQSRQEVLKMFDVRKVAAGAEDPAGTVHVQLNPRPGSQFDRKFKSIDVWVDLASGFPRRIETVDRNETEIRTTELSNVQVNSGLENAAFAMDKAPETWTHRVEQMAD